MSRIVNFKVPHLLRIFRLRMPSPQARTRMLARIKRSTPILWGGVLVASPLVGACDCTTFGLDPIEQTSGATMLAETTTTTAVPTTMAEDSTTTVTPTSTGETTMNVVTGTLTVDMTSTTDDPGTSTGSTNSGDTGTDSTGEPIPDAADLLLSFSASKQFNFTWPASTGAKHYQLMERPRAGAEYTKIGGDIFGEAISLTQPLHFRFDAGYILRACNDEGCADSESVDVDDGMRNAVGYLKASNTEANDQFGTSVAISADGNTLAIGADREDSNAKGVNGNQLNNLAVTAGAVYIFVRTGETWMFHSYVKASNPGAYDQFGMTVALSADGSALAVGAPKERSSATGVNGDEGNDSIESAGAAYLFRRENDAWMQQAYIKASNTGANDLFGDSVALSSDGNTLVVSAPVEDGSSKVINGPSNNSATDAGAIYVFTYSNATWEQQAYIKAPNADAGDFFGRDVAISGDGNTIAAGAWSEASNALGINGNQADNSAPQSGAAYVFIRTNGLWSHQAYIKASNTATGDGFGQFVALSSDGNTLAVGSRREDSDAAGVNGDSSDNSTPESGAVYTYTRLGKTWSFQAYIKASNTGANDYFGSSIAISADGSRLAIGATDEDGATTTISGNQDDDAAQDSGAVYVFEKINNQWAQRSYVKAPNAESADKFGTAVSFSGDGDSLVVCAPKESSSAVEVGNDQSNNSAISAGACYNF